MNKSLTAWTSGDNRTWLVENTVNGHSWIPDLEPDTKYQFVIHATAGIYYSQETILTWRTYMYAPEVTVASRTHNRIRLTWTPVEGAQQYRIQYVESDKIKSGANAKMTRLRYQLSDSLDTTIQRLNPYVKYTIFVSGPTRSTRSRWSLGSSTSHYVKTFQRSCKRSTERFYGEVFKWPWLAVKRLSRRHYNFSAFVMKQQYYYGVRNWWNELVSLLDHSGDTHYCQFSSSCTE